MKTLLFTSLFSAIVFSSVDAKACAGGPLPEKERQANINQVVADILTNQERAIESVTSVTTKLKVTGGIEGDCGAVTTEGEAVIRYGKDCFGKYEVNKVESRMGKSFNLKGKAICF